MSDLRAPLHRLSPILDTSNALQVASKKVLQDKKALVAHVEASIRHFRATVADVICKINEHAASSTAGLGVLCHDRAKVLDAQTDELTVSAGQLTVCMKAGKTALAPRHHASVMHALLFATELQELCRVDLKPRVSAKLDIAADVIGVIIGLENMAVLRLYDVDRSKSVVSGAGLVSCVRGMGAVNEVNVACVNSAGEAAGWVTVKDVLVDVRSVDGEVIGRTVGGQVIEKGEIMIKYEVDIMDAEEVEISVSLGDVVICGGPWRAAVCSSIRADAVHIKTNRIIRKYGNYGVAVTLDGLHLVVSNYDSHNISVHSMVTGGCITTFGRNGSAASQFDAPVRICATPRGTVIVSEVGNKRLQEITITGEHVRFIGEGLLDNDSVFGVCMHREFLAVGKHGENTDGCIVLFSYSSGALIRKFGSFGSSDGQVKNVTGLSFTPDGRHILVVDFSPRLSMFTADGAFVETIGVGKIGLGCKDVLCSGSSIFVADQYNQRIRVFSADTGALIRTWGTKGQTDGQFMYPTALAAHKGKLFVLDFASPRIQIFE
jgi:hypothetical protein